MINPIWLRSFCKLVEEGHFTRTSEKLNMTQSGVSQHIKKLEGALKTELLIRQGKTFFLTEAGENLYLNAQKIIEALDKLQENIQSNSDYAGELSLMLPGSAGLKLYNHLLSLQVKHPKLSISCRFGPNKDVEKAIAEHSIDVGLMTEIAKHQSVKCQLIAKESLFLIVPANVSGASWETLIELGFIDHPDGAHHANLLLAKNYPEFQHINMFNKKGFSNQINLILEHVSQGLGFTVLPAFAAEAFTKQELISIVKLPKNVEENIYLATHRWKPLSKRAMIVMQEVKDKLKT
ncbi:MAG: DNA-binding transcriptional LysR family regulator [Glaciecola sp.]|jgi:DNA-binding transcriptional LysR family regulator